MAFLKHVNRVQWWMTALVVVAVVSTLIWHPWRRKRVIQHDVTSYYSYLPAVFVYGDPAVHFADEYPEESIWVTTLDDGSRFLRMTSGCAIMWLPFFLPTWLVSSFFDHGEAAPGYTIEFHFMISLAAVLYLLWGLYLLYKALRTQVNGGMAMLVATTLYLASNLYYYTHIAPGMSHVYSFFLVSVFLYGWWAANHWKKRNRLLLLGLSAGMVVLIRPTNVVILMIPFAWEWMIHGRQSIKRLRENGFLPADLLVLLGAALLPVLPQLIYWKVTTGQWITYSYTDEGFFWGGKHLLDGLLSYRKGWLIYSPVFLIALAGLIVARSRFRKHMAAITAGLLLFSYVTYSWWCWWYGGGFGARPFIEFYPLLALPLAAGFDRLRWPVLRMAIALLFVIQNIYFVDLERDFKIHYDAMSREAWARIWSGNSGQMQSSDYLPPDYYGAKYFGKEIHFEREPARYINGEDEFPFKLEDQVIQTDSLTGRVGFSMWVYGDTSGVSGEVFLAVALKRHGETVAYHAEFLHEHLPNNGQWHKMSATLELSGVAPGRYTLARYMWNPSSSKLIYGPVESIP